VSHPTQLTTIKIVVKFPLGQGQPYKADDSDDTTVLVVRQSAMQHFGVHEDPASRYFLTIGAHHDEVGDDRTLKSVDEEHPGKGTLTFTLVKELVQG
jgi:hypothetical protein